MLFVTFLLSVIILFLLIYAYSVIQIKKQNNESSSIVEIANADNKTSLFDKFKRKKAPQFKIDEPEDSSVSVGGVTAKVSPTINQPVAANVTVTTPAATKIAETKTEEIPSRHDRVAPEFSPKTSAVVKSKEVDKQEVDKQEIVEKVVEEIVENTKVDVKSPDEKDAEIAVEEITNITKEKGLLSSVKKFLPARVKATEDTKTKDVEEKEAQAVSSSQSASSDVALEQMAEEYAAQQLDAEHISPDTIEQEYAGQRDNAADSVEGFIPEEPQQDLLEQVSIETSQIGIEHAEAKPVLPHVVENSEIGGVVEKEDEVKEPVLQENLVQQDAVIEPVKKEFRAEANAIEIVAKISGGEAITRDEALVIFRRYDYLFTRYLGIYGKNSLTEHWENVEQSGQEERFSEIALSLQLADKTGAMTRKESNTFSTLALEMSDKADKKLEFSMGIDESVEKGRMLDELARKYDAMVVCNIIPKRRKGFRSTDIKSCTKDLEMLASKNGVFGRYAKISNVSSLRYSLALANSDGEYISSTTRDPFQVDEIVVFLNVALVVDPCDAFQTMISDARKLGAWMDGKIVDKDAKNMTSRTLDKIAEQITMIEKEMNLDGLVPGSGICKKLF